MAEHLNADWLSQLGVGKEISTRGESRKFFTFAEKFSAIATICVCASSLHGIYSFEKFATLLV